MLITARGTPLEIEDEIKAAVDAVEGSTACLDFFIELNLSRATVDVPKPKDFTCDRLRPRTICNFFKVKSHGTE